MRIASWINKATDTHSEYVTVAAFSLLPWFHESASILRYSTISVLPMKISAEANVVSQRWIEEVIRKKLHSYVYSSNSYLQQIIYRIVREKKGEMRAKFSINIA
jgi:hypothetical protein